MENLHLQTQDDSLATYQQPNRPNGPLSEINLHLNKKSASSSPVPNTHNYNFQPNCGKYIHLSLL